ncbi:transketolase [Parablautia muri]|uniref:Transketolase n=1 Tax=Parablautia muri TaxID=2320879 RepID=A0A9X5BEF6_9FIRM|nr:transketolase [Parablautia muri]NBJ92506.1 transketolase [Parablautia muri]
MSNKGYADVEIFAIQVKKTVAKILNRTHDSHIGGGYSAVDILAVLYTRILDISKEKLEDPNRNVFILSKGHIAATMYTVLAYAGIIPKTDLDKHTVNGENYAGHTRRYVVPGIEMSAGSLGHGAGIGSGMAFAKRCQGLDGNVYVLMGDGECNEGSVWEAAMFAAKFQLSNLVLIVDRNRLQSYGSDKEVMDMGDMGEKFRAFGCQVIEIDGHDYAQIYRALTTGISRNPAKPTVVIANTIKGKGISFMENKLEWHFKSPNDEQLKVILEELSE